MGNQQPMELSADLLPPGLTIHTCTQELGTPCFSACPLQSCCPQARFLGTPYLLEHASADTQQMLRTPPEANQCLQAMPMSHSMRLSHCKLVLQSSAHQGMTAYSSDKAEAYM